MAVDLRLSMKLGQQMVMTPQLQAAIKLLQMNRLELIDTIQNELTENPLLEESNDISELEQKKAEVEKADEAADYGELAPAENKNPDFDWESYLEQSFSYTGKGTRNLAFDPSAEDGPGFESVATKRVSLQDHLLDQINTSDFSAEERSIAQVIINSLDDWGYLREPLSEIATKAKSSEEDAELVLRMLQELEPAGVCARDLRECLMIQLRGFKFKRKIERELVKELIDKHLTNLEKKNFKVIAKEMGLDLEELGDLIKILQRFEPRPGRPFAEVENPYITPDIYVYKMNGEYVIGLNEDGLPKLKISNLYRSILKEMPDAAKIVEVAAKAKDVEKELTTLLEGVEGAAPQDSAAPAPLKESPKEYIKNKLRSALWLIRSIHQRQRTIYKVTESIIRAQRDFLEHGVSHLRPMVLKDIANDIGMHESTISRVTSNKYIHTPQGIFELKFFFSSAIQRTNGQDIAAESVKEKIRAIIKAEDLNNPISDQGVVDELRKQGIEIARRTVAKYREMLGILPSSQRKALF